MSRGGGSKIKSTAIMIIKTQPRFDKGCQAQMHNISQFLMDHLSLLFMCNCALCRSYGGANFWILFMFGGLVICFVISYIVHLVHVSLDWEKWLYSILLLSVCWWQKIICVRWWSWSGCGNKGSTMTSRGRLTQGWEDLLKTWSANKIGFLF